MRTATAVAVLAALVLTFWPGSASASGAAPTAVISGSPLIAEGDTLLLDASGSSDPEGDTLSYAWDLDNDGDHDDAAGATPVLAWNTLVAVGIDDDGSYPISVAVSDGTSSVTDSVNLTVVNRQPTVTLLGGPAAPVGLEYQLRVRIDEPGDDTISSWILNWGDGSITTGTGTPTAFSHVYAAAGPTHAVTLQVTDEDGTWLDADAVTVNRDSTDKVSRYTATTGGKVADFGTSGGAVNQPYALALGPDGMIYVSGLASDSVVRYDPADDSFDATFVTAGAGGLDQAKGIEFGPDGNLYVSSAGTGEVLRYNGQTGAFIDAFVPAGTLTEPGALLFAPGNVLLVADQTNDDVERYNATTGASLGPFVTAAPGDRPTGMTLGPTGNLFVNMFDTSVVKEFDGSTGALVGTFVSSGLGSGHTPVFGPDGELWVTDYWVEQVKRFDAGTGAALGARITESSPAGPTDMVFLSDHLVTVRQPLVVDATGDASDPSAGDGTCGSGAGTCTLRAAIEEANALAGPDAITFAIAGAPVGGHVISLGSALPLIIEPVAIDASTEPEHAGSPVVVLDAQGLVSTVLGVAAGGDGTSIRGLVIRDSAANGIRIASGATGVHVAGNYIGSLNVNGTDAGSGERNGDNGVRVDGADATIGGPAVSDRNVISGNGSGSSAGILVLGANASDVTIEGNYIGVDATGTVAIMNNLHGVRIENAPGALISDNVISGNNVHGLYLYDTGTVGTELYDNVIGTNASQTAALANGFDGVRLEGSSTGAVIGAPGRGNTISGNTQVGVNLNSSSGNVVQSNTIGTNTAGSLDLGNGQSGVHGDAFNASTNLIGGPGTAANSIAHNADGVTLLSGVDNAIVGNAIWSNDGFGIDLGADGLTPNDGGDPDPGPNDLLNFPTITSAVESTGTIAAILDLDAPAGTYRLDVFANPGGVDTNGEGEQPVGAVLVAHTGTGTESFALSLPGSAGDQLTATATETTATGGYGSTSEFSPPFTAIGSTGPPVADAGGPYNIGEGDAVALDASASFDPQGDPLSYSWDLDNDGSYDDAVGETPTVPWAVLLSAGIDDDGVWPIGVRATDGSDIGTAATTVIVANAAPIISVSGPSTAGLGVTHSIDVSTSDAGDDTVAGWTIDWGDGTVDGFSGAPGAASHTYTRAGVFDVLVSVTDEDGTWSEADLISPSFDVTSHIGRYTVPDGTFVADLAAPAIDSASVVEPGPDGLLYVSSYLNGRVVRLDPLTNSYLDTFVTAGAGGLAGPMGLEFGPNGNLFVADWDNDVVREYDGVTGASVGTFVTYRSGGIRGPSGARFGPDGNLWVVGFTSREVYRYDDSTGAFIDAFVTQAANGGLNFPEDLTWMPGGDLLVASSFTHEIKRYDGTTGAYVGNFVAAGSGGLNNPTGIQYGPDGDLYVASRFSDDVKIFDGGTGAYLGDHVAAGSGGLDGPLYHAFVPDLTVTVAEPLTVNSTNDTGDATPGDGVCDTGGPTVGVTPECTLRAALEEANANADQTVVAFAIPQTDPGYSASPESFTLIPGSVYPDIVHPIVLDARTQPEFAGTPIVVLDGLSATGATAGLVLETDDSLIAGFVVHGFDDEGLEIDASTGGGQRNTVRDNWVGVTIAGAADGNADAGVLVTVGAADNSIIDNVISANTNAGLVIRNAGSDRTTVQGNIIGAAPNGTTARPNGGPGIQIYDAAADTVIGGTNPAARNIIANNGGDGVEIQADAGSGNAVVGNHIWANLGLGIDLGVDGVDTNDVGDVDAGANDLLNHPVVTVAGGSGGTIDVGFDLDVPAGTYRIEVFTNPSGADPSGSGEAEVFAGAGAIMHGGSGSESFSIQVPGGAGDLVAITATEAAAGLGSTSELSTTMTATLDCADTDGDGLCDIYETPFGDTDGDLTPNEQDTDDDGDGTLTAAENADPNGDGNPRDALDTDRDGQPDYLDAPTSASAGTVANEQKISDTQGGLTATLDDDDRFGRAATSVGDLDGDGVVDLAVGAFLDDDGGTARGAVHVLFMNADGTVKAEQKISSTDGGLTGPLDNVDYFGLAVSGLGDVDGDGIGDLAVGAYRDDDGGTNRGAVYVLLLNADGTVKAEQKISATTGGLTAALADNDWFGVAVAGVGDLDGDGINDLAVGAADDDGGTDRGAVYVLLLNADGTVKGEQKISDTAGSFAGVLDDTDMFGEAVAGIGDLDGDGVEDIVVGANGDDDGASDRGAVYILFLNTDGTVKAEQKISSSGGGLTATLDSGDRFGAAIAGVGDVDGDGVLDVAVGAHLDDDGGSARGAVHLLFLNTNGTVKAEQKISATAGGFTGPLDDLDFFGHGLAGLGDIDGDGSIDLAVGAHTDDDGGSGRGAVYILNLKCPDADGDGLCDAHEVLYGDTDGDLTPNELDADDDDDGTLTAAENADPNGDGDPRDALDTDRDAQPDYLDLPTIGSDGTVATAQKISETEGGLAATLTTNDHFGRAVASIGDVDADGVSDIAVGAHWDNDGGADRGAVYVLFLNADGTVKAEQKISDLAGAFGATLGNSDEFGVSVTGIGDLDGDGVPDIVVGSHQDDDGANGNGGAVYVLFLNPNGTVKAEQKISETEGGLGVLFAANDRFGSSVATIGDLDGDGLNDIVVGAKDDDDGGANKGAVYVLFLNGDGTVKAQQKISQGTGGLAATIDPSAGFGIGVAGPGDVDGDGNADIAVGAYWDDDGGTNRGAVYVLFLDTDGTVLGEQKISDTVGGFAATLDNSDEFGTSVGAAGDVDADGVPDILVGAPKDDDGTSLTGAAYVLFLNSTGTVKAEQKISNLEGALGVTLDSSDQFGFAVAGTGDRDEDGTIGIAVGVYGDDDGGPADRGAVYILDLASLPCLDSDADGLCDSFEAQLGDTDGDLTPNELDDDDDDDLILTASENADPNGDGDPRDALDSDRDGQPDYLDAPITAVGTVVDTTQKISASIGGLTASLDGLDGFGTSTTSIGDLDGDGVVDVAVGAYRDDDGGTDRGAVHILFLNDDGTVKAEQKISDTAGGLTATLDDGDLFGTSVAGIGDIDGDGVPDLAAGAQSDDDGSPEVGAVHILFLNANGTVKSEQKISATQGGIVGPLLSGDGFGSAVGGIGDLDGDGTNDIAVGATSDRDGGGTRGAVHILFLNADGTVKAEQKISSTQGGLAATIDVGDAFGGAVTGIGDIDADGIGDIAVGAWGDGDGGPTRGAVHVLRLNADGTVKAEQKISSTAGGLAATIDDGDFFGQSIAAVGDIDGDGIDDVAVGAVGTDQWGQDSGSVHLLLLNTDGSVKAEQSLENARGGIAQTFVAFGDVLGSSVTSLGDLNNDGTVDIMTGAVGDDDGGTDVGAVYTFFLTAPNDISGTVFEDIAGDVLTDGSIGGANNPGAAGVDVHLYNGLGGLVETVTTNGSGSFTFTDLANDAYTIAVDSKTVPSSQDPTALQGDIWASQTYGPAGAPCADGAGGFPTRGTAGPCYGGQITGLSDGELGWENHTAVVSLAGADITGVDFGFSFNVVVHDRGDDNEDDDAGANRTVQGSLRQFIQNANAISGANMMRFVPASPTNASQVADQWWNLNISSALPSLTDAGTTIDGTAFDLADGTTTRDTNTGFLGANAGGGLTVGVDDVALPVVNAPELELTGDLTSPTPAALGLAITADDVTVRGLAVLGFASADIRVGPSGGPSFSGIVIEKNVIGARASGFVDPGPANGTGRNVYIEDAESGGPGSENRLRDNLIGFAYWSNVELTGATTGWIISGNEIRSPATGNPTAVNEDALRLQNVDNSANMVSGNLIDDAVGGAIETWRTTGGHTITNNTITGSGHGLSETFAIRLMGTGTTVEKNVITGGSGPAVLVVGERPVTSPFSASLQNRISQNQFGSNGGLAIDLVESDDNITVHRQGDGVSLTAGTLTTTGNNGVDAPTITSASTATVLGTTCAGCDVEVYRAVAGTGDTHLGSEYGEGVEYLGTASADGAGDWTLTGITALAGGDEVSAITIDGSNNTSEFAANMAIVTEPVVNSTGDAGDASLGDGACETGGVNSEGDPECTLRAAIQEANVYPGHATVTFDIPTSDPGYAAAPLSYTITPGSFLGFITDPITLDATTQPGHVSDPIVQLDGSSATGATAGLSLRTNDSEIRGFIVHSFDDDGLEIDGSTGFGDNNTLAGNWTGIDASGAAAPNLDAGVVLAAGTDGNQVGGTDPGDENVIAGNGTSGIHLREATTRNNTVIGNHIGVLADGTTARPNGNHGIRIHVGATDNRIGGTLADEANIIAHNGLDGVHVEADAGADNAILGNEIHSNGQLGIDLGSGVGEDAFGVTPNDGGDGDSGPNDLLNRPVITGATEAAGTVTVDFDLDVAAGNYRVEFFVNPGGADISGSGEGEAYVAVEAVVSHPGGSASYSTAFPGAAGDIVTATTTESVLAPFGATSEFSAAVTTTGSAAISGTVFEDVIGDVLDDGTIGDANNPGALGVDVYLYLDDGDSNLDAGDTLIGAAPVQTDANGDYSFNSLADGDYFVVIDSKTVGASVPAIGASNTWAEQTYGPVGGYCDNGIGFTIRVTAGPCYGGIADSISDDFTQWDDREHRSFLTVTGSDITSVDFGFSFNVVTTTNGGDTRDDDLANGRTVQGSLRQFIQNANAISGGNAMRLVPPSGPGAGGVWTVAVSDALPTITGAATTVDGTAFDFSDGTTVLDTNASGPELVIDGSSATATDGITVTSATNTIRDLVIGGFADTFEAGILIQGAGADNNVVSGVYVGTNATATAANGNYYGIRLSSGAGSNIVGGTIAADRNIISGNTEDGVSIAGVATDLNIVRGNYIGLDAAGTGSLGNGDGIYISGGALNTIIGGASASERNVISGNSGQGLFVTSDSTNIWGNYIGTNAAGTAAVGNLRGVWISGGDGNLVGAASPVLGNLISGNTFRGVLVANSATNTVVAGNLIGTDAAGTGSIPNNGPGVEINFSAADTTIGGTAVAAGNVIANNTGDGIFIAAAASSGNEILGNHIHSNGGLGIDVENDGVTANSNADAWVNYPVITSATAIAGTITVDFDIDLPAGDYRIELFKNPAGADPSGNGEGETYVDSHDVIAHPGGAASYSTTTPGSVGDIVTATATEAVLAPFGATSEFSAAATVVAPNATPTADAGGPYVIAEGEDLDLDATGSSDPDGDTLTYDWDLDNDGAYDDATTDTPTIAWATLVGLGFTDDGGPHAVGLRVDDTISGTDTDTTSLTITNTAPDLTVTGTGTVATGALYTVNLGASDPGDDTITSWIINWGDGTVDTLPGASTTATHTYTQPRPYNVTAAVVDEDGTFTSAELLATASTANAFGDFDGNTGDLLRPFSHPDLAAPVEVTVGPDGLIYASGLTSHTIVRFDLTTGLYVDTFVPASTGGLTAPGGIVFMPGGDLLVASFSTNSIKRFDGATGAYIGEHVPAGADGVTTPLELAIDNAGRLYASSWTTSEVRRYDLETGAFIDVFVASGLTQATGLAFGDNGNLYVGSANGAAGVHEFNGTTGAVVGQPVTLAGALGVAFGPDGNLWVTSPTTNVVNVYTPSGTFLRTHSDAADGLLGVYLLGFAPDHQVDVTALTVNSTADGSDSSPGDGVCTTGSTNSDGDPECTLRAAIQEANAIAGPNQIHFAVPDGELGYRNLGVGLSYWRITPATALPSLAHDTDIDATTQTAFAAAAGHFVNATGPEVELDGSTAGGIGLRVDGGSVEIRGLVINRFATGISVLGGSDSLIAGNYIGPDASGALGTVGNTSDGIYIAGATGTTIGGADPADQNVISGNRLRGVFIDDYSDGAPAISDGTVVVGNHIGTDAAGENALPYDGGGNPQQMGIAIWDGPDNVIGQVGAGNVISGNSWYGIYIWGGNSTGNRIQANTIGLDRGRIDPIGNGAENPATRSGVYLSYAPDALIGGAGAGAGNTIAGNDAPGVAVQGAPATGNAIIGNEIFDNVGLGIDLAMDGVTPDDAGDADTGPNDLLNTVEIGNVQRVDGDLELEITLDVPAGDYRIDVFGNTTADVSGRGEGETYLGATTITHTGSGSETFSATVTAAQTILTATVTEDLGGGAYGSTSEFSAAVPSPELVVVNSTGDDPDAALGDGQCDTGTTNTAGNRECTLRAAIQEANDPSTPVESIWFSIPATEAGHSGGVWTIDVTSPLPALSDIAVVDATTQPGYVANTAPAPAGIDAGPVILLDGTSAGPGTGLDAATAAMTISGLAVGGFDGVGIGISADDVTVTAMYVGMEPDGITTLANTGTGITVGGDRAAIGGGGVVQRSLVAGNGSQGIDISGADATVSGSIVGLDATATVARPNGANGIRLSGATDAVIGTVTAGNVVSGNNLAPATADGIYVSGGSGHLIQANLIGTNAGGSALGNYNAGIATSGATNVLIGGTAAGVGNEIAHNGAGGVLITGASDDVAVLGNAIADNAALGIDVGDDGVDSADAGDGDTGPNDRLNAATITAATAQGGSVTVDFTLDAPAGDYRIELFVNPAGADPSGYGEGETRVAATTISHAGAGAAPWSVVFAGAAGDVVTISVTEDLGAGVHGATSEFSNAVTATALPSATVTDLSRRRSDLVVRGTIDPGSPVAALAGDAIEWSGGSDRLVGPALDSTSGSLSIGAWIFLDTSPATHAIVSKQDAGGGVVYELAVDGTTGEATATMNIGGAATTVRGGVLSDLTWHQVTVVWDGADLVLFVDGVEVDRIGATGALATDVTTAAQVGNRADGTRPFDGLIDTVRITSAPTGPTRVAAHHANLADPAAHVTVGQEQTAAAGAWTTTGAQARSGGVSLAAPETADAGTSAWAVATGIDEPGLVFKSYWWMSDPALVDLAAGTRTGLAPTDQFEAALNGPSDWEIRQRLGSTESVDATATGAPGAGTWVEIEIWTDQLGDTRLFVDGSEIIGWTAQGSALDQGSAGLRVATLPTGEAWYVDDPRARKLVTPEPLATLGALDRN